MSKFLIDANLPRDFQVWSSKEYVHLIDLDERWPDSRVWKYAKENKLKIIFKDVDFSIRMISSQPPPKVIHIRTGNMKMKEFHEFISEHWHEILRYNEDHKLVNVYKDRIIAINKL